MALSLSRPYAGDGLAVALVDWYFTQWRALRRVDGALVRLDVRREPPARRPRGARLTWAATAERYETVRAQDPEGDLAIDPVVASALAACANAVDPTDAAELEADDV